MRFSVKLGASIVIALFCLSGITSKLNGMRIENSVLANCFDASGIN